MRALSRFWMISLICGAAACGTSDSDVGMGGTGGASSGTGGSATGGSTGGSADASATGGTGGGAGDAGPTGSGAYNWLAIIDGTAVATCTTTGPGADIDSVDLQKVGSSSVTGVGLTGSASFVESLPGGPTTAACTMCGPNMMGSCKHSGATAASRVEGIPDGMSYADKDDVGYLSLNTGVVWLQIGSANGGGTAQTINSGDKIMVHEVDLSYVADGSAFQGCACPAEKYTVWAYVTKGDATTRVQLTPTKYEEENVATCGATPTTLDGCGTTTFTVP